MLLGIVTALSLFTAPIFGAVIDTALVTHAASASDCPGYVVSNVRHMKNSISATLKLGGKACNVYGTDIGPLTLLVEYQTST